MYSPPETVHARRQLIVGPRGSGKTRRIISEARALLDAGVPARRLLIVTFSPRVAGHIAAHLPAEVDGEGASGVWLQTAQRLSARLLRDCLQMEGRDGEIRVISAVERATLLSAAAQCVGADLGPDHALAPALADTGGLAEIELLLDALAGQGGTPDDLDQLRATLPPDVAALDRAVLAGVARVYRAYRDLCARTGGLTYQEIATHAAAALADPTSAAVIARRIDYLLIDDLERAEPAQIAVFARIAAHLPVLATLDPSGVVSERALRAVELARDLLMLDVDCPTDVLPSPSPASPALASVRGRLMPHPGPLPSGVSVPPRDVGGAGDGSVVVAEEVVDTAEAVYIARAARAISDATDARREGEPDVLILPPTPTIHAHILAALRAEGVAVVDTMGGEEVFDPAVRYALAWLRALIDPGDEQWERVLASPHARVPAADAARLRHWAADKSLTLHQALADAARSGCEPLGDAARTRIGALVRLYAEVRDAMRRGEAPSVTLHRVLAREDVLSALLVGPTDPGLALPNARGLAGLCALARRIEDLWRQAYAEEPSLAAVLDRLEQGLTHRLDQVGALPAGRVVLADPDAAIDWRAHVVIVPGLSDAFVPRPRRRSRLLSDAALSHLRHRWALPWPADFATYAAGERRVLALAVAAARARVVLTRALRYEGEDAAVPSPLLLDALGAARIDAATCRRSGARLDRWTVTHTDAPSATLRGPDGDTARVRRGDDLLALTAGEAARDLDTLLYRHARSLAARDALVEATSFIAGARALLADTDAPARGRYLSLDDPFGPLPATATTLSAGARLPVRAVNEYLYCPRRFFYGTMAGITSPANGRMHLGMLLAEAVQALLRLHPAAADVTVAEAEEVLRLLWQGEEVPGAEPDSGREPFADRFGGRLDGEAARALAQRALRRLVTAEGRTPRGDRVLATHVPVEMPITLPDGRTVRVTATVDRINGPAPDAAVPALTLVDYRSGASDATAEKAIGGFLNRKDSAGWRPTDYTVPVMFLGVAGNRDLYARHNLPPLPVRSLAVVSLGADRAGQPHVCAVEVAAQRAGKDGVSLDDLVAARDQIAATVAVAAGGPHPPAPPDTVAACRGCAYRFACPGPAVTP